jgi:hypothetical protein
MACRRLSASLPIAAACYISFIMFSSSTFGCFAANAPGRFSNPVIVILLVLQCGQQSNHRCIYYVVFSCCACHRHLKNLYRKVGELETGLVKLLSGSLITPAAAAALISSLNKIAASGVVKSLSSGGGGASVGGASDNKLIETIQKAALAAAAASSNGGAQPFAGMHMRLLASSIGSKKLMGRGSTCSSTTGQLSSHSVMDSTMSDGSSSAGCVTGGGANLQQSIAGANKVRVQRKVPHCV